MATCPEQHSSHGPQALVFIIRDLTNLMKDMTATNTVMNTTLGRIESHFQRLNEIVMRVGSETADVSKVVREIQSNLLEVENYIRNKQEFNSDIEVARIQHAASLETAKHDAKAQILSSIGSLVSNVIVALITFLSATVYYNKDREVPEDRTAKEPIVEEIRPHCEFDKQNPYCNEK